MQALRKELGALLNKVDKKKLINNALYKQIYKGTLQGSTLSKQKIYDYMERLKQVLKDNKVTTKKGFKKVQIAVPLYVSVEVTITGSKVAYKAKKGNLNFAFGQAWRPGWTRAFDEPVIRAIINNLNKNNIGEQIKNILLSSYFFETEERGFMDSSMVHIITASTTITYRVVDTSFQETNLNTMSMYRATPLKYEFIESDFTPMTMTGECVIDNLVSRYKDHIKVTRESIRKDLEEIDSVSKRFVGVETVATVNTDGDVIWVERKGWTTNHLADWCASKGIAMYAFDQSKNLFRHVKRRNNHYPPLVFFAVNQHMYLVTSQKYINSMYRQHADGNVNSAVFKEEVKRENIYEKKVKCNLEYDDLKDCENCVVLYDTKDLRDVFLNIFKEEQTIYDTKNQGSRVIEIEYKTNHIRLNPNYDTKVDNRSMNYKDMKEICDKNGLEFQNQSISAVVSQLKDKMMNAQEERKLYSKAERDEIKKSQDGLCASCKCALKKFQVDHIVPLASGGSNDEENLQALCVGCHTEKSKKEKEGGDYVIRDVTKSSFNPRVEEVYFSNLNKHWAFIESREKVKGKVYSKDINKCRRNIVLDNKYDWPIFTVMDDVHEFSGDVQCGLYYVESKMGFPLRGNGWYYYPLVLYALEKKIIKMSDVRYEIIPSIKLPAHAFNELINKIVETFGDAGKVAVNTLVGTLAKTMHTVTESRFTESAIEAGHFSLMHKCECIPIEENLFMMYSSAERKVAETSITIYDMVIDMEVVELHKLASIIESKGGKVVGLMTDCVSYVGKKLDLSEYKWSSGMKYKDEVKVGKFAERMAGYVRREEFVLESFRYEVVEDVEGNDFTQLVEVILSSGKGCMIDARAGCGKTYLVNEVKNALDAKKVRYQSLAPTNKACRLLGGNAMTIHRFYNRTRRSDKILKSLKYIFVDEVSMMKEFFYHFLLQVKKRHPGIVFVFSGDWRQCRPVLDRFHGNYNQSYALHHLVDGRLVVLTNCRRSDDRLFNLSLDVNKIDVNGYIADKIPMQHLCFTNSVRKQVNLTMMREHVKKKNVKDIVYHLKKDGEDSQDVLLCRGMPVISRVNNSKYDIVSNETFRVKKIVNDLVYVEDSDQVIEVELKMFQKLFNVAFCITVDKSQGSTFDFPYMIHEWKLMDVHRKYTAVTRGTKIENLFFA